MVDGRRRHARLNQFDPPPVHNLVVGRCRDGHGPTEMMGYPHTHDPEYAIVRTDWPATSAVV